MEAAGAPRDPSRAEADSKGKRPGSYSGRLLLRMPETLHGELARASERAGVSLNAFINDALAEVVGGAPRARQAPAEAPGERGGRRRLLERLLIVNVVVIAVVGVVAIVLLVQALR